MYDSLRMRLEKDEESTNFDICYLAPFPNSRLVIRRLSAGEIGEDKLESRFASAIKNGQGRW